MRWSRTQPLIQLCGEGTNIESEARFTAVAGEVVKWCNKAGDFEDENTPSPSRVNHHDEYLKVERITPWTQMECRQRVMTYYNCSLALIPTKRSGRRNDVDIVAVEGYQGGAEMSRPPPTTMTPIRLHLYKPPL